MKNKQFVFSLVVSSFLVGLGVIITQQANIGVALLSLGVAIALLALMTRQVQTQTEADNLLPIPTKQQDQD